MNKLGTLNEKQGQKVFIVDDHDILREGLSELINREKDLEICGEADSVSNAVRKITGSESDIVIVDLMLEDGSGIRLIENLLYSCPGLKILVLSMYDELIYAERCIKAGARGYIMKNKPSEKLISAIRKVLNGEIYVSRQLRELFLNKFAASGPEISTSPLENLSNREMEIYQLIGEGLKKHDIAEKLNLSPRTVETYIEHIKKKMGLKDTHGVIIHAIKNSMKI